ncbi:MAG: hypothetical protein R3C99_09165 [Pirellulaceae bacterium]
MSTTVWHFGHLPFLPAAEAGVFTELPQRGQANSIGPVAAGAGVGFAAAVDFRGISTTPWQCGHLPFLPAAAAGVFTSLAQSGQLNSIGPPADEAAGELVVEDAAADGWVAAGCGMSTIVWQCGQRPFLPALEPGTRTGFEQLVQANSSLPSGVSLAPPDAEFGAAGAGVAVGWLVAGMGTTAEQVGQRPFFPAAESGTRTSALHSGQRNSIAISRLFPIFGGSSWAAPNNPPRGA